MASVAVNVATPPAQKPAQNGAGTQAAAGASPANVLDALFAALLTQETQGATPDQILPTAANDMAPAATDASSAPQNLPVPCVIPLLAGEVPAKPGKDGKSAAATDATDNKEQPTSQDNATAASDAAMLALLAQQVQPQQQKIETSTDATNTGGTSPDLAATMPNPAIDGSPDAKAAGEAQDKTKASATDDKNAAVKGEKSQSAKEFSPALAALDAPRSDTGAQHSRVTLDQPQSVGSEGQNQNAQTQSDDRQPRDQNDRTARSGALQRTETPALTNSHAAKFETPAPAAAAKPDAGQAGNFAQNLAAGATQTASATPNTAATLHTVSTLRDVVPTPDLRSLAVQIASSTADGIKHFDIRMDPAELGRVDVHLLLDDAGKAQASLVVEKPQTLELLQKDSSGLERALKDAGIDLSNNGLNFSLKGQERQQDGAPRTPGRSRNVQAVAAVDAVAPNTINLPSGQTGLDIRV